MENSLKRPSSLEVTVNIQRLVRLSPRDRYNIVKEAKEDGLDWIAICEHIRAVVDPMDVMTDVQIFGVEVYLELDAGL